MLYLFKKIDKLLLAKRKGLTSQQREAKRECRKKNDQCLMQVSSKLK
jgi:hypothetical protein